MYTRFMHLEGAVCGPGSIRKLGRVICGLGKLLVPFSAPTGPSPNTLLFPSPQKPTYDFK